MTLTEFAHAHPFPPLQVLLRAISSSRQILLWSLAVRDGARALDFYKQAFGAQEIFRVPGPDGRIAHAQMRIGDSLVFLADEDPNNPSGYRSPKTLGGTSFAIYMYVADADAVFDQSLGAGAESLFPVAEQPWGDREGLVRDPFGHLWAVAMRKSS